MEQNNVGSQGQAATFFNENGKNIIILQIIGKID
jgi:hypothetical protein